MKIGTLKLRTLTSIAAITFSSLSIVLPAQAQNVFTEDFQDGNSDGWAGSPQDGDIRLSKYQENVSLKMTGNAYALRKIDNISAKHIEISGSFAAENLNTDDSCKLEASADGKTWHEIGRVTDGQDDAVTLHRLFGTMGVEGTVFLGIRADGQSDTATCWTDNIKISGIRNINTLAADVPHGVLWGGTALIEPLSTHAFTPPEDINAPRARFTGTLNFAGEKADHFELLKDDFKYTDTADSLPRLPGFSFDLVHNDIDLIPVQRGPQPSSHPDWEWILEPGKIWTLASGQVSVSLPFALQERNANCIHNGVMAFEIDASGAASNMVYQIGSETCAYMQFNLWGSSAINFEIRPLPVQADIETAYATETSNRLSERPIYALPNRSAFGSNEDVPSASMSVYGYVQNTTGQVTTHYVGGCMTRFGAYPFCNTLDLPSYSWAKSMVAGIASMRLEKLHPGAMQSKIADYVPQCKAWKGVTFEHALDMTTGRYTSKVYDVDEASPKSRKFFLANSHKDKIKAACTMHKRREAPGKTFVYHTTDTYVLGTAITEYLRQHSDPKGDIFDSLVRPIFHQIGVSPVALQTRRTYDDIQQPFSGWGLTLHRNDIALIMNFLQNGGKAGGQSLLDEVMLRSALQQNPADRGPKAVIDTQRYQNGFWAWNAGPTIGCRGDKYIPVMSGYGGLSAVLFPNGHSYYYVSDGGAFTWARAAKASNDILPFCEKK